MPKTRRDISGRNLAGILRQYGYNIERQTGSHIRLLSVFTGEEHKITIPNHDALKVGTLNNILLDIAKYLGISKQALAEQLFQR